MNTAKIILICFFYGNSLMALINAIRYDRKGYKDYAKRGYWTVGIETAIVSVLFHYSGIFDIHF